MVTLNLGMAKISGLKILPLVAISRAPNLLTVLVIGFMESTSLFATHEMGCIGRKIRRRVDLACAIQHNHGQQRTKSTLRMFFYSPLPP
jgi:hypothetical protein